jgi:hypothetical protein
MSVVGVLIVCVRAGMPAGLLRTVAIVDRGGARAAGGGARLRLGRARPAPRSALFLSSASKTLARLDAQPRTRTRGGGQAAEHPFRLLLRLDQPHRQYSARSVRGEPRVFTASAAQANLGMWLGGHTVVLR